MYGTQLRLFGLLGISLNPLTLAKDFANAVASAVLGSIGKGASAIVRALLGFITSTSDPSFSSGWWSSSGTALFERVTAVTGSLLALAFMCSIITAMISGDRSLLARAFIRLPIAVLQIALVVTVTGGLVAASDQVAAEIAKGATTNLAKFVALDMIASITGSGIVGMLCGGLVILAALAVWAELLVRSALIYLAVLTAPLVFAAGVHPSVSGLKRRYIEGALALITSKIVVALAFATGSAMLSGLGRSPSFAAAVGALLEALVILGVAAFAPFILLRLFLGAEGIIAAEGLARRPVRSAVAVSGMAQSAGGASTMLRGLGPNGLGPNGAGPNSGGPNIGGSGGGNPGSGGPRAGGPSSGGPSSGGPSSGGPGGSPSGGPSSGGPSSGGPSSGGPSSGGPSSGGPSSGGPSSGGPSSGGPGGSPSGGPSSGGPGGSPSGPRPSNSPTPNGPAAGGRAPNSPAPRGPTTGRSTSSGPPRVSTPKMPRTVVPPVTPVVPNSPTTRTARPQ